MLVIPDAAEAENIGSVSVNEEIYVGVKFSHLPAPELYFNSWPFCVLVSETLPISLIVLICDPPASVAFVHLLLVLSYFNTWSFWGLVINTFPISLISAIPVRGWFVQTLPLYWRTLVFTGLLIVTPGISLSVSVLSL